MAKKKRKKSKKTNPFAPPDFGKFISESLSSPKGFGFTIESSFVEDQRTKSAKQRKRRDEFLFKRKRIVKTGGAPLDPNEARLSSSRRDLLGRTLDQT